MKKLKMSEILTTEAYKTLSAEQRRAILKMEQAKEYSGLRKYPDTCSSVFARIPESYWGKYTAREIGDFAKLLYSAYCDGKNA